MTFWFGLICLEPSRERAEHGDRPRAFRGERRVGPRAPGANGLRRAPILLAALLFATAIVGYAGCAAHADQSHLRGRYFLVVWSYEGLAKLPQQAHTFLTVYDGNDLAHGRVIPETISWLLRSSNVRVLGVCQGRNFSLAKTTAMACQSGKRIKSMGPYEITPELYRRALARIRFLDAGSLRYVAWVSTQAL